MRDLGPAYHVIDPDGLEAPLVELGQARVEQLLYRLAALGAQFAVLGRRTAAQ